ncbi:MAG: thymidylate synthase [Burkholderiaceae bacterium]|nr:thymidylate synthase [Burkholderiaceae bacterium]
MFITADTLDDLLRLVFERLLLPQPKFKATKEYQFTELFGPVLCLTDARARLSRTETKGKLFSALGELLWYLSGSTSAMFMNYYVPANFYSNEAEPGTDEVRSGYGVRLNDFDGINQIRNVIDLLKIKRTSRRAVIQLFDASDLARNFTSIPCTCTLQFLIRDDRLNMLVNMRSNDAFLGLPHDIFAFTMLQEIIARSVTAEVGEYRHGVGSLHLYEDRETDARQYLDEAFQDKIAMPIMPTGDPWPSISRLLAVEKRLRVDGDRSIEVADLDPYWQDLCRLLLVHRLSKDRDQGAIERVRSEIANESYRSFINGKIDGVRDALAKVAAQPKDETHP